MVGSNNIVMLLGVWEKPSTSQVDSGTINGNSRLSRFVVLNKKGHYWGSVTTTSSNASI